MARLLIVILIPVLVIAGSVWYALTQGKANGAAITAIQPADSATSVDVYSPILVTFDKSISNDQHNAIAVTLEPNTDGDVVWLEKNTVLQFTPKRPLAEATTYKLAVTVGKKTTTQTFTTLAVKKVSPVEAMKKQEQADKNFAQHQRELATNYPWYNNLPLQNDQYFVYFDLEKKRFIAKLYTTTNAEQSKTEIQAALRKLGVPLEQYKIDWQTQ